MNQEREIHTIDDSSLYRLVEQTVQWQQEQGISDPPADWETFRAWWKERQAEKERIELDPYIVVIEPDNGRYRACCPVLGDCAVTGATYDEAKTRLMELVRRRLTELRAAGQPLPRERGRIERLPVAAWLAEASD